MGLAPSRCVLCAGARNCRGGRPRACVECGRVFCGTCKKAAMAKLRAKTWRCTTCNGQEIALSKTTVSTLAGSGKGGCLIDLPGIQDETTYLDGAAGSAQFYYPDGVAVDGEGNVLVADTYNHCVRRISPEGAVSTLAGSGTPGFQDGAAGSAQFDNPTGVAVDGEGNVLVADQYNHMALGSQTTPKRGLWFDRPLVGAVCGLNSTSGPHTPSVNVDAICEKSAAAKQRL